jgi:tripartite-type tricarboxylate transporter receptor subunit TctC
MTVRTRFARCLPVALLSACISGGAFAQQDVAAFYKDKTVTLIVSTGAGGGYDLLARTIARHMNRHIPGNPNIIVQNMPGGGALVATNHLYSIAAKDGSVFAGLSNNTPFEPLFGAKEARYDAAKFNWLGSLASEVGLVAVWAARPVKTLDDARKQEVTIGSTGVNATPSFYARLLNETLGTKMKVIVGYKGQNEIFLAMERGELDASSSIFYSSLIATRPDWLKDKKVNLLVQYGLERQPELGDVPFAPDLTSNADDNALMTAAFAPLAIGRPYAMPPDVPPARVAAMRKALEATFADKAFIDDATTQKMDVSRPLSGDQILKIIEGAYSLPAAQVERLRRLSTQ